MTTITATLLTASQPQPVQVLVGDLPAGTEYQVVGLTGTGREWTIPGGQGISDGEQLRLVDLRSAINTPVRYELRAEQTTFTSNQVTVPYRPASSRDEDWVVLQSLDGSRVIPVEHWADNGAPRSYITRSATFDIHRRRRPVVVLEPASDGFSTMQVRLSRSAGRGLVEVLGLGGGLCLRTDDRTRDLPPSGLVVITGNPVSTLWTGDGGVSTSRVWDLELTWIDDPEPDTVPTVWSVDDVDALLSTMTVDQVDEFFSSMTVDEVDAFDWGNLSA